MIVDFSRHPDFSNRILRREELLHLAFHDFSMKSDGHVIVLSSRTVYGSTRRHLVCSECDSPNPSSYARENNLNEELLFLEEFGPRLTVLRLSNVFGLESCPNRKTFFSRLIQSSNRGAIDLDVSPKTIKDFLPVREFCYALDRVIDRPTFGVFNLGSSLGTTVEGIMSSFLAGFGHVEINRHSEQLWDEFVWIVQSLRNNGSFVKQATVLTWSKVVGRSARLASGL